MTDGPVKFLDSSTIDALVSRASSSPRRRHNLNLHRDLADPVQRFLNAGEPGSYVRPHRHAADRWEVFALLRGGIDLAIFADDGTLAERYALAPSGGSVVEIAGGMWHSFVIRAPGTVALEIKPGPYSAQTDKEFAAWSPREGEPGAERFVDWLATANIGERWTA